MQTTFSSHNRACWLRAIALACLCATTGIAARPHTALAQVQSTEDPRAQAVRLRNTGDLAGAVALLRAHLETYPDDGDALRLLAETLYWLKDFAGARTVSERALSLHPEDVNLQLQYARMLIETGNGARAREVLACVDVPTGGRADAILGTLAYWEGNLAEADRLISSAIAAGDSDPAILRIHEDIVILRSPWVGVTPAYQHDDQPINRMGIAAEAGLSPVAWTSVAVRAQGLRFELGDTATRTLSLAELSLSHYAFSARTDLELAAGAVTRSFGSSSDFTGRIGIEHRLPSYVRLGARAYRSPYFATEASLSQTVMTSTGIAYAHLDDPRGWLGEIAYQLQHYEDSNNLTSAYAWLLAPLVHSPTLSIRAGYSASLQTSSESRFALAHAQQPYPPSDPRFDLSGLYQPYYTPIDLQSHSAVGAFGVQLTPFVTLHANGSYAFHATETSPKFVVITTASAPPVSTVEFQSYTRSFNPWNAHASLELDSPAGLSLVANGDVFRTGFYSASSASLALVYRFAKRGLNTAGGY